MIFHFLKSSLPLLEAELQHFKADSSKYRPFLGKMAHICTSLIYQESNFKTLNNFKLKLKQKWSLICHRHFNRSLQIKLCSQQSGLIDGLLITIQVVVPFSSCNGGHITDDKIFYTPKKYPKNMDFKYLLQIVSRWRGWAHRWQNIFHFRGDRERVAGRIFTSSVKSWESQEA